MILKWSNYSMSGIDMLKKWLQQHWMKGTKLPAGSVYYIGGSDVLPPPLETEEENQRQCP